MATTIRPELSVKNKYWIDKHRYYELKHFCLQYGTWKKLYAESNVISLSSYTFDKVSMKNKQSDPTVSRAMQRLVYSNRIKMVEQAAMEADEYLYVYILKGVTEGVSYTYLKTKMNIPCSRDTYYDRYRRFFWILNNMRD